MLAERSRWLIVEVRKLVNVNFLAITERLVRPIALLLADERVCDIEPGNVVRDESLEFAHLHMCLRRMESVSAEEESMLVAHSLKFLCKRPA